MEKSNLESHPRSSINETDPNSFSIQTDNLEIPKDLLKQY